MSQSSNISIKLGMALTQRGFKN